MEICNAKPTDIDAVLKLHYKYQVDSIKDEDKKDGFVTTPFTKEQLTRLVESENGLFIAKTNDDEVVAYVMAASWKFWSAWPMYKFMINDLDKTSFAGISLNILNSYQYGPICLDKSVRGTGLLERIFLFSLKEMSERYDVLVTFVNKNNPRSVEAHIRKLGLSMIKEFNYNNNECYELACHTKRSET